MKTGTTALQRPEFHRVPPRLLLAAGVALLLSILLFASARGAYAIAPADLFRIATSWVWGNASGGTDQLVFLNIRLPRLVLGVVAGAALGMSGALMQGMFRNPLADPGLIGVSGGAALAAGITITMGHVWFPDLPRAMGSWTIVVTAFLGSLLVTAIVYLLSQSRTGTRIGLMLLGGVAINALATAGLGYLTFNATDEQLRYIQFWLLGTLGGARWSAVALVGAVVVVAGLIAAKLARPLNAIALGESQAALLGVDVENVKRIAIVVTALAVGSVTATTGIIGFIGLIAPHCVRILSGPDNRIVLPGSALLGAALVVGADSIARTIAAPAELPLGVLTAFVGVPFFLILLRMLKGKV